MTKAPTIPKNNPLLTDLDNVDPLTKREMKAELWFQKESFRDLDDDEDEEVDLDKLATMFKEKGKLKSLSKINHLPIPFFCLHWFWLSIVCYAKSVWLKEFHVFQEISVLSLTLCFISLLNITYKQLFCAYTYKFFIN